MMQIFRPVLTWTQPWYQLGLSCIGAIAVVGGALDGDATTLWGGLCALCVWGVSGWRLNLSLKGLDTLRPFGVYESATLTVVSLWMFIRLAGPYSGQCLILGALGLGWYHITQSKRSALTAHLTALTLELGLWVTESNSFVGFLINVFVLGVSVYSITKFASTKVFSDELDRSRERKAHAHEEHRKARDFGLLTEQAPVLEELPSLGDRFPTVGRATLDFLTESFDIQLRLLRDSLSLTTATILWRGEEGLVIRGFSSLRSNLEMGPFPEGVGLPGSAIRNQHSISLAPAHESFAGLPYYDKPGGVGSAYAMVIRDESLAHQEDAVLGILCVDREIKAVWTAQEKAMLDMVARKLSLDVTTGQRLKATDYERSTVAHLCAALQELNAALGLDEVANAVVSAVRSLVTLDLTVIATVEDDRAKIIHADGALSHRYVDQSFNIQHSLVKQSVDVRHSLPAHGGYNSQSPVFGKDDVIPEIGSLLIIPLQIAAEKPFGVLVLASKSAGAFVSPAREILELIAGQVAVKLDLSNAHEQIREMAMVDGMTGLKNHRTFQQAFDTMLVRATRRIDPLCLILMDIDHFKQLNDTYGHPFGDEVLKRVAEILGTAARKVDLAARYGGEEFALLLEDSDGDGGQQIAERVRSEIEQLKIPNATHGDVSVTISMGLSSYPADGAEKDELITHADQALYLAKHNGRNRVCCWAEVVEASGKVVSQLF
jgi:two-component system, cell cycle response regulator